MKDGIQSELPGFQKALKSYMRYNQRSQGPLLENRARRIRFGLYRRFKAASKTKDQLESEIASLGYRIRRRKRGDKRLTIRQEIQARKSSLNYLAASFIFRNWRRSDKPRNANLEARGRRFRLGLATIRTTGSNPQIRLTSYLKGAAEINRRDRIDVETLRSEVRDMERYIARKHQQRQRQLFQKGFAALSL